MVTTFDCELHSPVFTWYTRGILLLILREIVHVVNVCYKVVCSMLCIIPWRLSDQACTGNHGCVSSLILQADVTEAESPGTKRKARRRNKVSDSDSDNDPDQGGNAVAAPAQSKDSRGSKKSKTQPSDGTFQSASRGTNVQLQLQQNAQLQAEATRYAADQHAKGMALQTDRKLEAFNKAHDDRYSQNDLMLSELSCIRLAFDKLVTLHANAQMMGSQQSVGGSMHATPMYTPGHHQVPHAYSGATPPNGSMVMPQHAVFAMPGMKTTTMYPAAGHVGGIQAHASNQQAPGASPSGNNSTQ